MSTQPRSAPERLQEGLQRLGIHPSAWERYRPRGARGGAGGAERPQSALRVEGSEVFLEGPIIPADDEGIMDWLGITAYVTVRGRARRPGQDRRRRDAGRQQPGR